MTLNRRDNSGNVLDDISMLYNSTNRLASVKDIGSTARFKDGANSSTEYTNDANGNMISDANAGITNISYNLLNLPIQINTTGSTSLIGYGNDAAGARLRK